MCICKNIDFGTYDFSAPIWYDRRKRVVNIDICLIPEILILWNKGIITIESCCGHNKNNGYIMVDEIYINNMLKLNYTQDPKRENCFYPKIQKNNGKIYNTNNISIM